MSAPRANKLYGEVHVFIPDVSDVLSGDQSGTQFSKPVFTLTGGQVSCQSRLIIILLKWNRLETKCMFLVSVQIGASFGYSLGGVDFDGDG